MESLKSFLIFISIVLAIYGGINYYIYRRLIDGASLQDGWAWGLRIVVVILMLSYPLGRAIGGASPIDVVFIYLGAFWLAIMAYGLFAALIVDLVRLTDLFFGWLPNIITTNRIVIGRVVTAFAVVLVAGLILAGYIRSLNPVVREFDLNLPGLVGQPVRMLFFADTHFGTLVGPKRAERLAEQIKSLTPDIIVIAGDLLDEPPRFVQWVRDEMGKVKAPLGVWFTTGNHEFYSGVNPCVRLIEDAGIKILRDSATVIDDRFILVGLDDATGARQYGLKPEPIKGIIAKTGLNFPIILLHHSPLRIDEAAGAGAALMLCGHTHGGQMWPFGKIAQMVYGAPQGWSQRQAMKLFITNGAGTWGPPVRLGAEPELIVFNLIPS